MKNILKFFYNLFDRLYLKADKTFVKGENSLKLLPNFKNRKGGKISYAEWAHDIGVFKTLIFQQTSEHQSPHILDIGCGRGFLGIASSFIVKDSGTYTGVDINAKAIEFCQQYYHENNMKFIYLNHHNSYYNNNESNLPEPWPVKENSKDLVTALSVWTHLNEEHSYFYMNEVSRVLKPGGKAIITFFCLDEHYETMVNQANPAYGKYCRALPKPPLFNTKAYDSNNWFYPDWAKVPEEVIAVTRAGLESLIEKSGLKIIQEYPGKWKEIPGLYLQDVFILEK